MKKSESRIAGVLGTLILHLIAAIIFMSFQLRSLNTEKKEEFTIEFIEAEDQNKTAEEEKIELPASAIERILQGDAEMLNIARNLASRNPEQIDPAEYQDLVKEELIKSGKLSADNYIDEQKRADAETEPEDLAFENDSRTEEDQPLKSQEMAANYKGPTRIYYELEGRTHTYLPIPIYKCQGEGKVALRIEVNQKGRVEKVQVLESAGTTKDECLVETATRYAMISRFNADAGAPKVQTGTLTYHFVAQ
ncbi:MAG: energy transducer TonB [Bacteroidales bacterium]|jgi:TonB family protein|nr:energy transducer TonB [Bacteroidales bacterium]